ncbi:hypothetical protein GQX73_g9499 [Xylaria multiplex]|uniref:Small EDRK-rich factor-like N-terminal domain-containing protein n=1 Tax=Xylaria multiplex TaxID=323545 RepID=A0A7C8IKV9_9PEZI|nr:hypothetical protein GQX73_g9499 [Xylaria multiplex]
MGNGAKAQQKRERNAKDTKTAKSQLKTVSNSIDTVFIFVAFWKLTYVGDTTEREGDGYPVQHLQVNFPQDHARSSVRLHIPFPARCP